MDKQTLRAYDQDARAFAEEWRGQPAPVDLRLLVRKFFSPGLTADIGCGDGRDTAWLNENGFPTLGYDASEGLLAQARQRHPGCRFQQAALPELEGIANDSFANVLCETVVMHLESAAIVPSIRRLAAILEHGGTLYLSWRVTEGSDRRDDRGRLYAAFDVSLIAQALSTESILLNEQSASASSGKVVHRIIARKI